MCCPYLFLLDFVLLRPDDALHSDEIVVVAVQVLRLLVAVLTLVFLTVVHLLLLLLIALKLLFVTHFMKIIKDYILFTLIWIK